MTYYLGGILRAGIATGGGCLLVSVCGYFISRKQKSKKKKVLMYVVYSLLLLYGITKASIYSYEYCHPDVAVARGTHISRYSDLFGMYEYTFDLKFEEHNVAYFCDAFSMRKIHKGGLDKGCEYMIYYETDTKIIVGIEEIS